MSKSWSIPADVSARIIGQYNKGHTIKELSVRHARKKKPIARMLAYYAETGKIPLEGTRPRRKTDSEKVVSDFDREVLLVEIFEDDPSYFIYEAKNLLNLRTGKLYSTYAVIRAMERLGLTLKMVCAFCVFVLAIRAVRVRGQRAQPCGAP